jgi:hypothetical protein
MSAGSSLSTWLVVMNRILSSAEATPSIAFSRPENVTLKGQRIRNAETDEPCESLIRGVLVHWVLSRIERSVDVFQNDDRIGWGCVQQVIQPAILTSQCIILFILLYLSSSRVLSLNDSMQIL